MASAEEHTILPRPSFDEPVKLLIVVSPYYSDCWPSRRVGERGRRLRRPEGPFPSRRLSVTHALPTGVATLDPAGPRVQCESWAFRSCGLRPGPAIIFRLLIVDASSPSVAEHSGDEPISSDVNIACSWQCSLPRSSTQAAYAKLFPYPEAFHDSATLNAIRRA